MSDVERRTAKTSLIADFHRRMGASLDEFRGWQMPDSYRDPIEEGRAVRAGVGLIDMSFHGAVRVSGTESAQFLNGLVTNDVKNLERGSGVRAAFLTPHGKVKALCRILGLGGQAYLAVTDPDTHEKVYSHVFPFSYAGDFKVDDASDDHRVLSVQGPRSLLVMKEICFEPLPPLMEHQWVETIVAGHHVKVVRASHTGELGYDMLVPASGLGDVWDFTLLKGEFHSIAPFGHRALDSLRIEAGIPLYGADVTENNMMLETGLDDAVSFSKGCYTGQEAVVMATHRGHVSKKLSGLVVESDKPPARGEPVRKDDKQVGFVTSSIHSDTLGSTIALAYVKWGSFEPGAALQVMVEGSDCRALVTRLPFYSGSPSK